MSDNNSPPRTPPSPTQRRRSSFAEFFGSRSSTANSSPPGGTTPAFPSSIASAAQAQQNRRRMSINTIGISGTSPTNGSAFNAFARRRGSISSSQSSSSPAFEEAVLEENEQGSAPTNTPATPFARRVSFGAQAYRDLQRSGSVNSGGNTNGARRPSLAILSEIPNQSATPRSPPPVTTTPGKSRGLSLVAASTNPNPPPSHHICFRTAASVSISSSVSFANLFFCTGEGFSWSESMRDKANRPPPASFGSPGNTKNHSRAASVATMEPPKQMPQAAPPPQPAKPDVLGERMLRGDFMMD
ncbi:MAG: hypothetical protein Q9227_009006 [Pyrenula ochraceoflavens]